ncbi:sigma factor-like helix-turn-helix DNA-binding protein [Streptomyces sp. NBC_01445]|uniref:sigma factor-like helix-turn-helix DNA-binding protein n=1 Tax=Streptomyces sp. NBC_01445 TaxID=2903869 RepID=UPI002DDB45F3|nr:sigma factor-like helix-turn-helix DNA-binding protein [Streptomyces sp. NBC_01445]WSE02039.1 sigma-70 region 4 domain-containing protein [Streptomyces sp. NBC_01445]WSE10291.1 sigma-70 region 4 domain-containing protein [Streptomyces sp. NBC_01445]WSE11141.1 sigma-70 region 4 domain-containing protein [Streptomyces sp. NBC_01445]
MTVEISLENCNSVDNTGEVLPDHRYDVALDVALALPGRQGERIARDEALVEDLRRGDFKGPRYDMFENRLAGEALPQLKGMLRTGTLITDSLRRWKEAGKPFGVAEGHRHLLREDLEQRDILAVDILLPTLDSFRRKALVEGGWNPRHKGGHGPGCLMTYFIGRCSWEFRQQYEKWSIKQRRIAEVHAKLLDPEAFLLSVASSEGTDLHSGGVVLDMLRKQPRQTQAVLALVLQGYEQLEIADRLQVSRGAVANSIYRFRQKVLRAEHEGKIHIPMARAYTDHKSGPAVRPMVQHGMGGRALWRGESR